MAALSAERYLTEHALARFFKQKDEVEVSRVDVVERSHHCLGGLSVVLVWSLDVKRQEDKHPFDFLRPECGSMGAAYTPH